MVYTPLVPKPVPTTFDGRVNFLHSSRLSSDILDFCHDYSFWQPGRCSSRQGNLRTTSHPVLCNQDAINCYKTISHEHKINDDVSINFCQNSAVEEDCNSKGDYFCNVSNTCIPQGKLNITHRLQYIYLDYTFLRISMYVG